jgi:hypothetical protein
MEKLADNKFESLCEQLKAGAEMRMVVSIAA